MGRQHGAFEDNKVQHRSYIIATLSSFQQCAFHIVSLPFIRHSKANTRHKVLQVLQILQTTTIRERTTSADGDHELCWRRRQDNYRKTSNNKHRGLLFQPGCSGELLEMDLIRGGLLEVSRYGEHKLQLGIVVVVVKEERN